MGVSATRKPVFFLLSTDVESAQSLMRAITLSTSVSDTMECFWFDSLSQCKTALSDGKTPQPTVLLVDLGAGQFRETGYLEDLSALPDCKSIPLIALVSNIETADHTELKAAGADYVIPRSTTDSTFATAFLALSEQITSQRQAEPLRHDSADQNRHRTKVA